MGTKQSEDNYSEVETAKRRDELLLRLLKTPPQPRMAKTKPKPSRVKVPSRKPRKTA